MGNKKEQQTSAKNIANEVNAEEKQVTEEEKKNNRFSFIVGIVIAMVLIVLFAVFFR